MSLFRFLIVAIVMSTCLVNVASAAIAIPTLRDLVKSADLVIVGKATSVASSDRVILKITCALGVLFVAGVFCAVKLRAGKWGGVLGGCLLVAIVALLALPFIPAGNASDEYASVARISIAQVVIGTPTTDEQLRVYYDDGFVCDQTNFVAGTTYLLFLEEIPTGYTVSWYDYSQWPVIKGLIRPVVLDESIPLTAAVEMIRSEASGQASLSATVEHALRTTDNR